MLTEKVIKIRAWIVLAITILIYPVVIILAFFNLIIKSVYKPRKSVAGEVALITGSGNGLGKEIAIKLAAKGCHIAVVDINEEAATSTAKHLSQTYNVKAKAFMVDIAQYDKVKELSKNVEEQLGPVTILVNNAGIMSFSSFLNPPPSEIQNMINTNIAGHIWTVRIFMDKMRELRKGHIVAICSLAGVIPCCRHLEYTTTKFGIHGFMLALRTELYAVDCEFIKTTTVFPSFLDTNAKAIDVYQKSGTNDLYPLIPGAEAAEAVVEGIVTNKMEVFIPGFAGLLYRLLELLPKDWHTKIINDIVGRERMQRINY